MPALRVQLPEMLDRRTAPELLRPGAARMLRNMDVSYTGRIERAPGVVRPNFASGLSSTVISCGAFQRRDGRTVLVWQTAAGSVDAQYDPEPAYLEADF